jgi:hypothetical protein
LTYKIYEIFCEENCPENSDYLPITNSGLKKSLRALDIAEEKIKFKLDKYPNNNKLLLRLEKIKDRKEELNDWKKWGFLPPEPKIDDVFIQKPDGMPELGEFDINWFYRYDIDSIKRILMEVK